MMSRLPLFCLVALFLPAAAFAANNLDVVLKDYNGREYLDPKGKFLVSWLVNFSQKKIYFNVTVSRTGWVGLGFSYDGQMKNADMVVAGVSPTGKTYITDYYTDCERNLRIDGKQDWYLLGANQYNGKTVLYLSRLIDTCDTNDYAITDDLVHLLWAYGETDKLEYHYENRGSFRVYLLDPVMHESPIVSSSPRFRVTKRITLPTRKTTYWCSIHKAPPSTQGRKNHMIQFSPIFENEKCQNHTHHFVLYRCKTPDGVNPFNIFEPLVNYPGEHCYFNDNTPQININLCRTIIYFWTLGQKPFILPDHVGVALGETGPNEYYLLETHFVNVGKHPNIECTNGVEAVYTDKLRQNDGGALLIAYDLTGLFLIPPAAYDFEVYGHCGTNCTSTMFPSTGVDVYAAHLHSHSSAKKMKVHHFRGGQEKSWIMKDNYYDYTFQQIRPLHYSRTILGGDQITVSCTYDFSNQTELSGFANSNKMCVTVLYHVTPIPYFMCVSQIAPDKILSVIGVGAAAWDSEGQERIVSDPAVWKNMTLRDVSDFKVDWTYVLRERMQAVTSTSPQSYICPKTPVVDGGDGGVVKPTATYPFLKAPYGRVRYCPAVAGGSAGSAY